MTTAYLNKTLIYLRSTMNMDLAGFRTYTAAIYREATLDWLQF